MLVVVMAVDAWREPANRLHLLTDAPALLLAVVLLVLRPAAAPQAKETSD